ncbi:MAG: hypothetical protein IIC56_04335 [Proteobacteria bacterium]|nr:hypothetical protein [Pseudomonadota bacterium]
MARFGIHSRLIVCTVLGPLLLAPAAAWAQTAGQQGNGNKGYSRLQGGQWGSAQARSAAQRIPLAPVAETPVGLKVAQAKDPLQQAQTPPAQPRGRVRIQGRTVEEEPVPLPAPAGLSVDLREQMRKFVLSITNFSRRHRRNFMIVTRGGLELLIKRDPADETRISPARTYIRAIDGVLVEGVFFGSKVFGEPPPAERQARTLRLTDLAKANGLKVFVMDFGDDPKTVEESHRRNKEKGYVSITAHAPAAELNSLPPYPRRPYDENAKSIVSLKDVLNFAVISDSSSFGRIDEFALKMHRTNYDLLIVDVFHGRTPLSRQAVETLKYKRIGAKRLVFATVNVGSAASYRYYWKPTWGEGSPPWIGAPLRDDPDSYNVKFWRPEWQRIISGDTNSYIYGAIAQGFDGVVLEGIEEAYRFFEGGGEEQEEEEEAPAPTPTAEAAPAEAPPAEAPPAAAGTPPAAQ